MSRDLIFLASSLFLWGIGDGLFMFFQPLYLQQLGAQPVAIGAIMSSWAIAMAVAHLPAGFFADRLGRRPLIWASWQLGLLAVVLMALARSLTVFVIGLSLYGVTAAVMAPMNSYITAARGKLSVGRALTLVSSSYNLGAIIGPVTGGWIAGRYGLNSIFWFAAGLFFLSNIVVLFLHKQPIEVAEPSHKERGLPLNPRYIGYLAIMFLAIFGSYLPQPLSSNFLQNQKLLDYQQIGQLGSVSSLGVVVLNLVLGQINAGIGFLLGQAAVGIFALLLWRGTGLPSFAIGYFLMGGYRTAKSLGTSFTRDLAPPSKMGLAYGLTETVCAVATILAPFVAGVLYEAQPDSMYIVGFGLVLLSILAGLIFFMRNPSSKLA